MNFEFDYSRNIWGESQTYKQIQLYPFLMEDYKLFYQNIGSLLLEKDNISDINYIKMSYLKFLFLIGMGSIRLFENEEEYKKQYTLLNKLDALLSLVFKQSFSVLLKTKDLSMSFENFRIEEWVFNDNLSYQNYIKILNSNFDVHLIVNNLEIKNQDFNIIKDIIFIQNAIPLIDKSMHPDLRQAIEDARQMTNKDMKVGSIEEQIIAYHVESKMDYDKIKKLTIYQFRKGLERMSIIKNYQILSTAKYSGMVEFKSPIPYWLSPVDEHDYSDVLMNKSELNEITKKVQSKSM